MYLEPSLSASYEEGYRQEGMSASISDSQPPAHTGTLNSDSDENNSGVPRLGEDVSSKETVGADLPLMYGENEYEADSDEQRGEYVCRVPGICKDRQLGLDLCLGARLQGFLPQVRPMVNIVNAPVNNPYPTQSICHSIWSAFSFNSALQSLT
jgi:hypothetical protein